MVVIADASPLNYLVLIDQIGLLPRLFTEVFVPDAVIAELSRPKSPPRVAQWIGSHPDWIRRIVTPPLQSDSVLGTLGRGEREAISFAETLRPDVLLVIDEIKGRRVAMQRQIPTVGILGILETASVQGWISLPTVVGALQDTNFRISASVIDALLERDNRRKVSRQLPEETR